MQKLLGLMPFRGGVRLAMSSYEVEVHARCTAVTRLVTLLLVTAFGTNCKRYTAVAYDAAADDGVGTAGVDAPSRGAGGIVGGAGSDGGLGEGGAEGTGTAAGTGGRGTGGSAPDGGSGDVATDAFLILNPSGSSSVNFGSVVINSAADETYQVWNTGQLSTSPLTIALTGMGFSILPPSNIDCAGGTILAGGSSCTIRIRFTPPSTVSYAARLSVSATSGGTPPVLSLVGVGTCLVDGQCPTVHCVDAVCCNEACNDGCHVCNLPESRGVCASRITEYPVSGGTRPYAIAVGPDRNIWFTDQRTGRLGKVTLAVSGPSPVTTLANALMATNALTAGPDGRLWFVFDATQFGYSGFGSVNTDLSNFQSRAIPVTAIDISTSDILKGSDGNLWVADYFNPLILRISPTGDITGRFSAGAFKLAEGADKAIWSTTGNPIIARLTIDGTSYTEYPLPTNIPLKGATLSIAAGPDTALWFTTDHDWIGRMNLSGNVTNYYPALTSGAGIAGLTTGPDGAIWFTEGTASKIGRVSLDGSSIRECPTPTPASGPTAIVAGPDGNLWFTESTAIKLGRFIP